MNRVEKTVFISYRRTNEAWALAISQNLTQHGYDVFMDFTSLPSGDFTSVILENIRARAHFLILLTPSALERCGEPNDWLRREIEAAIDNQRNIVPLMLEGFSFGTPTIANQLTGKLDALKRYNGLNVPPGYFIYAMNHLREKFLSVALTAVIHPASIFAQQAARKDQEAAATAPAVEEKELTAQQWFEQGFNATDPNEKLRCFSEAIRLQPNYFGAYIQRSHAREKKGDFEGALRDRDEAIRLQPDNLEGYLNRGDISRSYLALQVALRASGEKELTALYWFEQSRYATDPNEELRCLSEAIRLQPDYFEVYIQRSHAREKKGDVEGALRDCDEAIRLQPDNAEGYLNRGNIREGKGEIEGALRDYDESIRLRPDYVRAYLNRSAVYYRMSESQVTTEDSKRYYDLGIVDSRRYLALQDALRASANR
jgi:tetratricopeptide (TPR) repeat protein